MYSRTLFSTCLVICSLWLLSCESKPPQNAVLTLRRDGSHFYGTVVRQDKKSITVSGPSGDIHTFMRSDLWDVDLTTAQTRTAPPKTPAFGDSRALTPLPAGGDQFEQPAGTQFAIRSNQFVDSCCTRLNDIELGILDADIKNSQGVVMIPKGANITFTVSDQRDADGRLSMTFELSSADYGGHHYLITPGASMTMTGAKGGTPEASVRGRSIHLENQSPMSFKAASPIVFKLST